MNKSIIFFLMLAANLNIETLGCTEKFYTSGMPGYKTRDQIIIVCPNIASIYKYNYTFEYLNVSQTLLCSNSTADDFPILPKFSGITDLILTNFHVKSIKPGAFKNLEKLNSLNFHFNNITEIPDFKLIGIGRLEKLDLVGNNITQINKVLDANELYLGDNQIETINVPFGNVTYVILYGNKLKFIKSSFFKYPERLQILHIQSNEISTIDNDLLVNMTNLDSLNLSNNTLTQLNSNVFDNLKKLKFLWLSNNKIKSLPNGIFNNLINLQYLFIDGNKFKVLDQTLLKPLSSLLELNLSNNQISSWDVSHLKEHSPNLYKIYMNNNKWKCPSLIKIIEDLEKQDIEIGGAETHDGDNVKGIACTK